MYMYSVHVHVSFLLNFEDTYVCTLYTRMYLSQQMSKERGGTLSIREFTPW